MSQPDEPYHAPHRPPEKRLWKGIAIAFAVILVAMVAWWLVGLSGDAAERDTDDPVLEPLEPATSPAPILRDREPPILAA